ncbi:hypothetical protein [Rhizobium sp. BK376]|uniref:hypothetical protein n=1 Tax=Rhizobium sp. BK376 TaxID=2512149 RepID=UPI0010DD55A9|nr:hypothetical protein [Rhizobium sp. BK376]TCR85257.1 pentatricopeptide repeat protein [Rhizobium sp. BK376]
MNFKALTIAALLSSLMWAGSFDLARHAYRDAQRLGVVPNLHIKATIHEALDDDDDV